VLTDDLRTTLRDRARDVTAVPSGLLDGIERKRSRHRRRLAATTGGAAIATAAVVMGVIVLVGAGSHDGQGATITGAGPVPCAEPTREVLNYVDWPCPTNPVSDYDRQEFDLMLTRGDMAGFGSTGPGAGDAEDLDYRVLAFGALPNSRASSSVVFAEVWQRAGNTPAHDFVMYTSLDTLYPGQLSVPPTGAPLPGLFGGGPMQAGDPKMFVAAPPTLHHRTTLRACTRRVKKPPAPKHGYVAGCTDTVFVRAGITAIRVVQPDGHTDAPIPVDSGLAGLSRFAQARKGWSIQGLDADGNVVATVAYKSTI
jgi:hypothetical protein